MFILTTLTYSYSVYITNCYITVRYITKSYDELLSITKCFLQVITNTFPQVLNSFPQVLNSFPQDESYKPLQTLRVLINLWKTIMWKTNDLPYRKLLPLVENYFSTGIITIIISSSYNIPSLPTL